MKLNLLSRRGSGTLTLRGAELMVLINDMFAMCRNEEEIDWVEEQLISTSEIEAERRREELGI